MSDMPTIDKPKDVIAKLRPNSQSVVHMTGGDNRDVYIVDGTEAFRFAKDASVNEANIYEYKVLQMLQGKLSVALPEPLEIAADASYTVQSFLQGTVLKKHEVAALSYAQREQLGLSIASVMKELQHAVTTNNLVAISAGRPIVRSREEHYEAVYETAKMQDSSAARMYQEVYEHVHRDYADKGKEIIVFGDFSSPNLVLDDNNALKGIIDWTELGTGDIHHELRPVYSVIGPEAFAIMAVSSKETFGSIDTERVKQLSIQHELAVLVSGKQKGELSPARKQLAQDSLNEWLGKGWDS